MNKNPVIYHHQVRIANLAVSPSSFRNQGKKNTIQETRNLLYKIDLNEFKKSLEENNFATYLDETTNLILSKLDSNLDVKWGTIRKGLNIFFRDIMYNHYLVTTLNISFSYLSQLELPLDSYTGHGVVDDIAKLQGTKLKWTTIKELTPEKSKQIQEYAETVSKNIHHLDAKVDLDLVYWRRSKSEV